MVKIYISLFLVMLMWGFNLSALKVLVDAIDPVLLTSFRILTAGIAVLVACRFMGILRWPLKHEWLIILGLSIFNVILHHIFIAVGLEMTTGVNASLILGLTPLVTMMMTVVFLRQHVTWLRVTGFILGFLGVVVANVSGSGGIGSVSLGDFIVFLGVAVQGFSFVMISKLKPTFDPRLATGYMMVMGSVIIFVVSQSLGAEVSEIAGLLDWKLALVFLFSAIIATAFGHMTYNFAITQVGPAESAIFINLNTLFAITGAAIFLNEAITLNHVGGFILILIGVFFGTGALEYLMLKRKKNKSNV